MSAVVFETMEAFEKYVNEVRANAIEDSADRERRAYELLERAQAAVRCADTRIRALIPGDEEYYQAKPHKAADDLVRIIRYLDRADPL